MHESCIAPNILYYFNILNILNILYVTDIVAAH